MIKIKNYTSYKYAKNNQIAHTKYRRQIIHLYVKVK